MDKKLIINGIRGIPASYGGFETFAEYLSLYLVERDWDVTVYCQGAKKGPVDITEWKGIKLVTLPSSFEGSLGTVVFDLRAILHSLKSRQLVLTLGYNTALFNILYRIFKIPCVMNMDGIEWKRDKWSRLAKSWFWLNERFGCWFSNFLVADHPKIKQHLATRVTENKIQTIPYGAEQITYADIKQIEQYGLLPDNYAIVIARPEPENSILEIVRGFSQKKRYKKLVVLGNYSPDNQYHQSVLNASSEEVIFLGAIYDSKVVNALRFFARCYVHGHTVGGTNPSLVEAMGCGSAIVAHDNDFNKWVVKGDALFFKNVDEISDIFDSILVDDSQKKHLTEQTRQNFENHFKWGDILKEYEKLLESFIPNK